MLRFLWAAYTIVNPFLATHLEQSSVVDVVFDYIRAGSLNYEHASVWPRGLVKTQRAELMLQSVWGGAWESVLIGSSQGMLMLAWGPPLENYHIGESWFSVSLLFVQVSLTIVHKCFSSKTFCKGSALCDFVHSEDIEIGLKHFSLSLTIQEEKDSSSPSHPAHSPSPSFTDLPVWRHQEDGLGKLPSLLAVRGSWSQC